MLDWPAGESVKGVRLADREPPKIAYSFSRDIMDLFLTKQVSDDPRLFLLPIPMVAAYGEQEF